MSLLSRIAKKIARRLRPKGKMQKIILRPGRNRRPLTATDLWRNAFHFTETKPARAGTKQRLARERKKRKFLWNR